MEAQQHIEFFSSTIPTILNHYDGKEVNELQYFALGMLRRLEHGSISLKILLQNFEETPEVEFSSGLIIRALYLDMLISLNLYKIFKENHEKSASETEAKESVSIFCKTFLADGLDQTATYLQQMVSFGFKTNKELQEAFNSFAKSYPTYFSNHKGDGSKPKSIYPKAAGPSELFKKLASDKQMKYISAIYDSYLYYSKYDHFGILYFETHLSSVQEKAKMINKALRMFIRHAAILYEALDRTTQHDTLVANEYKKVSEYMLKVTQHSV
jgi:hypothetical protein